MKYYLRDERTEYEGVLLTMREYEDYKKLSETVERVLERKKEYDKRYCV